MLRGLLSAVERMGVPYARMTEALELRPEELEASRERLSLAKFAQACEVAVELTGDPALGVHWAELMNEHGFGPISEGLAHASTLRHAFLLLERFEKFFTDTASFEIVEEHDQVAVRIPNGAERAPLVRRFLSELSAAWYVKLIGVFCPDAPIRRIAFDYEAPPYRAEYERVFGPAVQFAQPFTELTVPRACMDTPRPGMLKADGAAHAEGENGSASCSARLYHLLSQRAPERLSMPDAARALGLGERSLRRRLTAEGHSFKEIEFRILADVAKRMLFAEQRSVEETAIEMGFSGPNAFYRAFKRWTGQSPSNYQSSVSVVAPR